MRPLLLALLVLAVAAPAAQADDLRVTDLRVEHLERPFGIDAERPRLTWQLDSQERNQRQTAYQVVVTAGRDVVWDSGRVRSDQSVDVEYAGRPLQSGERYAWRVRVWDRDGDRSGWSRAGWWETGLLDADDWRGEWIGPGGGAPVLDLEGAEWIWYPEGDPAQGVPAGTRYFRARVDVPAGREVTRARLTLTADNELVAYVNGEEVASAADWTKAVQVDVADRLTPGTNVIAIAAENYGGAGALIGRLRVEFASGEPLVLDTGPGFKAMNAEQPGWQEPGHDDAAWPAARSAGEYGIPPWNTNVTLPRQGPVNAPVLRRQFTAKGRIERARAYVSGIGHYELRVNGRRIGEQVLDPTYTEYEDTVLYTTHDVTRDLRPGPNGLEVTLAPGFYYYDAPKLLMQVAIEYADGRREVIATDDAWEIAPGPTSFDTGVAAEVFGGETFDARVEPSRWTPAPVVPEPGGRLVAQAMELVEVAETVEPDGVTEPRPGTFVVDMGRTLTGWIRLRAGGAAGDKLSIQYGEKLNADGTVNAVASPGPRPRWQRDEYVFRGGGTETWEPRFTFKSFRYVQFDGADAPPEVRGRVVHSAVESAGEFDSSSELYDRIHDAMRRTTLGGLLGFPAIDPAHEKNGWTGDMQLITPSMTDNFRAAAFLTKWLGDVRDSQRPDGSISMIAPIRDGCCYAWAPGWTGAYPIVAWELYRRYGDRRVLESHYEALVRNLRWQTGSLVDGIAPPSIWGDWASPGYGVGPEDRRLTATAYVFRQAELTANIARVLGRQDDAAAFQASADTIRERFNAEFLRDGRYVTASDPHYRQASNAIPLAFGMVPEAAEDEVLAGLVADVRSRGNHLNTGILGTPALLEALTSRGHADLAHAIASQTTYPSWGEWIEAGADTLWESWGRDARSLNHPMHGTVDDWFFRSVAGIVPDEPGFKRFVIAPHPGELTSARATHESPYGTISSAWRIRHGRFTLDVEVPVNTTATVRLPDGHSFEVGSGRHRFRSR